MIYVPGEFSNLYNRLIRFCPFLCLSVRSLYLSYLISTKSS